jgi:hypothetical protein
VSEFRANPVDLRVAYHACISLLSLRDWSVVSHKNKAWQSGGVPQNPFITQGDLAGSLSALDARFDVVADVANAFETHGAHHREGTSKTVG